MGSHKDRGRRPFIWQDEMAEVKNLFRKVAEVKNSSFTGFSVWKDEPTAETLSKNRLRRRRSQYALDLTHLNYSESPYQALNHLHNIRGMCSRIQRQDLYVERKKKDYDADLHPSLLRRPITVASACGSACNNGGWDAGIGIGDRASLRRRPNSAPYSMGTPLHYTAPKPTVLYDATHKCPRNNRGFPKRPSSAVSTSRSGRSHQSVRGAAWESSSALSSPVLSSSFPSSTRTHSVGQSTSTSYRLNKDFALQDGSLRQNVVTNNHTPRTTTTDVEVSTFELYSSEVETGSPVLSSSVSSMDQRPPSSRLMTPATVQERPPSRQVSKRPQQQQQQEEENRKPERRDELPSPVISETTPKSYRDNIQAGVSDCISNSPSSIIPADVFTSNTLSRPSSSRKDKDKLSDRGCGLWALKQQQQRPMSADSPTPGRAGDQKPRPSTSPSQAKANSSKPNDFPSPSCLGHSKVRFGCSTPTANKSTGKRDEIAAEQRCFHQELHQVLQSDESCSETDYSGRTETDKLPISAHERSSGANRCQHQASSTATGANEAHNSSAAGDDSHVLIKHSTDPYADFKSSMMNMINEEGLIDKEWELEELFQYYMDLNPVVHHDILRKVISDIRKHLAAEKANAGR